MEPKKITPHKRRLEYQRAAYSIRQLRDCVAGSSTVKRSGELYLPIPSGMLDAQIPTAVTSAGATNPLSETTLSLSEAPWFHSNRAYSAYLHRAKFPDIVANTLRGLVGVATRESPEVTLPGSLKYLEELATLEGETLDDLYETCLGEVFQTGRLALVLDIRPDNTLYIALYTAETYINWKEEVINGKRVQTYAEFETLETNEEGSAQRKSLIYSLEENENGAWTAFVYHYVDGKLEEEGRQELLFQGKPLTVLPIVNLGTEKNNATPGVIPLLGVSDCALDIYRHSADLNQSQFMTCNPTLVFIGVDAEDAPKSIGATIAICLSDPGADAKYVNTDASALGHMAGYIQEVFNEAVQYGAALLGPTKRAAESAEALALRQANSGATLVSIVARVGAGLQALLQMAADITGTSGKVAFEPNYEFAELTLTAPEIVALMNLWMNGGVSHLTLLENMAAAGKLMDRSPEDEMGLIEDEGVELGKQTEEQPQETDNAETDS